MVLRLANSASSIIEFPMEDSESCPFLFRILISC